MALAGCFAFSAAAQDNSKTVCPEGQTCPKAGTTCGIRNGRDGRMADKMYRPQRFTDFAFEGILLDMNQQARVDSLNAAMASGRCANAECANKDCCAASKGKCNKGRHHGDRREYVKKVKNILTPEQYTVFLENIVMMPDKAKSSQMRGRRPDGPRGKEIKAVRDGKRQKDIKARVENRNADKK